MAFLRWLRDRASERAGTDSGPLKIMYRIDGSPDLQEEILDHLSGYRDSAPVHIGNGATDQLQLDIYGEAVDSLYLGMRRGLTMGHDGWNDLCVILDWLSDNLVYRYDPAASPDGLRGSEGTFSICTFWYVDALARSGRLEDARLTFEKMLTYSNHLGLFAEEIGPTGEQLGNFPQAFTHLSMINAAINLDAQLDKSPRWVDLPRRPGLGMPRPES